ncbi:ROK family transcriptional regulator [Kitasatospora sp. NPDC051914]|uniref:ROK family transcriptional regulator n=1 Tax=Kitasatospora sp. NPDC051914 TaxID=3154945 RepID=UPI0034466DA2
MRETEARRARPASQQGMRRANLALVLGEFAAGPRSRAEVAAATGLTRAAVSSLVDELAAAGLVSECGPAVPSGRVGRPGTAMALDPGGPAGLGGEIGVEHLAACVVDLRGEVRGWLRQDVANRGRPVEDVLRDLAVLLREVADSCGLTPAGLAVAVPGLVGSAEGVVERAPNLGWSDLPLAAELRRALREADADALAALPVEVDNEANLGGLAELWLGDGPDDFLHLSAEAGIGAALVIDGRLLRGARGYAGELGHVPVHPDGPHCPCGARGCLEQYAGEAAVLRAAGLADAGGDWVALLARRAADGDPAVRAALAAAGSALGVAAAGAVNLLDPAALVLGGGYAELAEWLVPAMRTELAGRVTVRTWQDDWLSVSTLGRRGPLLGAALGVVRAVVADPGRFAAAEA